MFRRLPSTLTFAAVLCVLAVAGMHAAAARQHATEAADYQTMALEAPAATTAAERAAFDEMVDQAAIESRVSWLLWAATAAGVLLVVWWLVAVRTPPRRTLAGWCWAVAVTHLPMLAAGVASRTSIGLFGHTDQAGLLWAACILTELAAVLAVTAVLAAIAAAAAVLAAIGVPARVLAPGRAPSLPSGGR
jgi:hypothetical protein